MQALELNNKFVIIDSNIRLEGIYNLRGFWLSSTIIVSLFSSCILSSPFSKWILFGALPFVGDLLLKFCLPGGSVGASDDGLAIIVLGLPFWVLFIIVAAFAGIISIIVRPIGSLSFIGRTKWYGCRVLYTALTLLNSTFRIGYRLFHASCTPLHTVHFLMADLSTLVGQSFELYSSAQ
jgi:hypothetical protein